MSSLERTGLANLGPTPWVKLKSPPMASAVTNISENRIAASIPSKSTGSMVTSAASSGVLHIPRNEYLFLISQYSFIKRPAWRIIHTGGRSVFSENAAFISSESLIFLLEPRIKSQDYFNYGFMKVDSFIFHNNNHECKVDFSCFLTLGS